MNLDVVVVGVGAMGSAACRALARRGAAVLGLERFGRAHDRGSSHGETRIIRRAYFEHPSYVPLLHHAYRAWAELEAESGQRLFERTGLLLAGAPDDPLVAGTRSSAEAHGLELQTLDAVALRRGFPWLDLDEEHVGLFEADAGFLHVERAVAAAWQAAEAAGARIESGAVVHGIERDGESLKVRTDQGTRRAARVVVTAGAWSSGLLDELGPRLSVERMVQLWFEAEPCAPLVRSGAPTFACSVDGGFFYGFPAPGGTRVKLAEHGRGARVQDPVAVDRSLHDRDVSRVAGFAARRLRGVGPRVVHHATCLYTMSPDGHFIVDRSERLPGVTFAAGFSGHGFKFAAAMGEILADLALDGCTRSPIEFLSARRWSQRPANP